MRAAVRVSPESSSRGMEESNLTFPEALQGARQYISLLNIAETEALRSTQSLQ